MPPLENYRTIDGRYTDPVTEGDFGNTNADVNRTPDVDAVKNEVGEYRVNVYDQKGQPVEGVVIQLCDDVTCAFQTTDANGIATFVDKEQKVYDVHVLAVPEGYAEDTSAYKTLDTFSDVNVFLVSK